MRVLTSKDGDLSSYFDKINENNIKNTSWEERLIDNHTIQANKGKIFAILLLRHLFGFCKTFKKITEGLCFHLIFKTADLHNIVYTTLPTATSIVVRIKILHLLVPMVVPSPETQSNFNNSIRNSFTVLFDFWTTDRGVTATSSKSGS